MTMIRLQAGYYQDIFDGEVYCVAKRGSKWECQAKRNDKWHGGFKTKKEAATYARYLIVASKPFRISTE